MPLPSPLYWQPLALAALPILAAAACDGTPTSAPERTEPGYISVHTETVGRWINMNGYQLLIDRDPYSVQDIGLNDTQTITVTPGVHEVELFRGRGEVWSQACGLDGGLSRNAEVFAGQTTRVAYSVYCEVVLRVTARTTGEQRDPDGYRLLVGSEYIFWEYSSAPILTLQPEDMLTFDRGTSYNWWQPGETLVAMWDMAPNCTLVGPNPVELMLGGGVSFLDLEVDCVSPPAVTGSVYYLTDGILMRMNADGSSASTIAEGVASYSLSPNGNEIVLEGWYTDEYFRVARSDGSNERLLQIGMPASRPSWSHGNTIVFQAHDGDNWEVFSIRPDGTQLRRITSDPAGDQSPSGSPDGARVAFVRSSTDGLVVADSDGGGEVMLATGFNAREPEWSPDGSRILFSTRDYRSVHLYTVAVADGRVTRIMSRLSNGWRRPGASWSPDGTMVVYAAAPESDGRPQDWGQDMDLFVVSAEGRNLLRLTDSPEVSEYQPAWAE